MGAKFVYFDLENTHSDGDIIQIGAIGSQDGDPWFNQYLMPEQNISRRCTEQVHGISKVG